MSNKEILRSKLVESVDDYLEKVTCQEESKFDVSWKHVSSIEKLSWKTELILTIRPEFSNDE